MGQMKNKLMDFLDNGGRDLEYDDHTYPDFKDMDAVLRNHILIWEYFGKTHKEYYGGKDGKD